jgi:rhodanese-related sulfurtransferase
MPHDIPIEVDCPSVAASLKRQGDFLLVDCREADEYALARIEGARLLPMSEIESRLAELEPFRGRPLVVHCHHGGRSLRVAQWLRGHGFTQAQSMAGGIDQWSQEIDPSVPRY